MLSNWIAAATLASLLNASPDSRQFVELVSAPHVTVAAGKPAAVELRFHVSQGFHINSNLPRSSYLIPTKLSLNPPTDVGVGKVTYPPGRDIELSFAPGEKLNVYTGDFAIGAKVSAVRTATPGHFKVHGDLSYQACNDRACYPPKKLPVSIDVTVSRSRVAAETPRRRNPAQSPHIH